MMQCPNVRCHNRALHVQAETDSLLHFDNAGVLLYVTHGEYGIPDDSEAYCPACHWAGFARDCREPRDSSGNP